ncbi:MAG: Hsp20/alpha crystallin family protein [Mycolicibacterium neoaurum]|uniref:Hsp20/alpha crystallin family protein n=1 Tax=Mycolicibacterium neoaurum TaxID=1795 RepID=A0AAV2WEV8_MYCNE|nr:Hsp20/alpha crystallin family protein [Mycolicibacterium neoaurum]TLH60782.1 Hsp20/alpha crystallin family protein [Mycolicibacterium neoaurum]CDQ42466.1 hsp20/alpha crystallin family protein [Mycolicibacterium neoaurum]SDC16242.1 Molecular chaperone IbpA, HSP20 family [Mycolicibacterium neoaurum]
MSSTPVRTRPASPVDIWLRDFFGNPAPVSADFHPAAEVVRDGDDAVVRLELPGVDVNQDVHVELDRGQLVIHGERRDEHSEGRTLSEVRYGAFRRSFKVPAQVTGEAVTASYEAGVLTVRVAGVYAGTEPQRIAITTK